MGHRKAGACQPMMAPVKTANKEHLGPKLLGEDFNQAIMFAVRALEEDNALKSFIHAPSSLLNSSV
ncbi:hypothetical protein GCWU000182_01400 [Abiotrophia defectiva ATCC 49176]|uniref:Uncharacterized protein n=1 Tax=Abiotrophia defectiva ATCC 49176 TaxID=592010 RepID=W1Q5T3_ABIDE|nr:hypothetical protein GCWU000182_01400 [Abiotrophia defectiva ATCC 49176]